MKPEDFLSQYEDALKSQNWENVAPLIHKDACITFSTGAFHEGKATIQKAFEHNFSIIKNEDYSIRNVRWILKNESTAVFLFEYFWQGIINGNQISGNGNGTSVLIFENGKWVLLTENLSRKV